MALSHFRQIIFRTILVGLISKLCWAAPGHIIEENIDLSGSGKRSTGIAVEENIDVPDRISHSGAIKQKRNSQREEAGYLQTTTQKLANGLLDIATSWIEIPKTIVKTTQADGLAAGLTLGVVKGIANTAEQAVSGAINAATFPVPQVIDIDLVEPQQNDNDDSFSMEKTFGAAFGDNKGISETKE